jgi:glc operon protein GlcG
MKRIVLGAVLGLAANSAWAQVGPPATLAKVTLSSDAAKKTLNKMAINADTARAIVDACVQWTKQQPGNVSIAIYVLDPMGNVVDAHQMDGVVPIGNETAKMKAQTVLYARSSSAAVAQRFNNVEGRVIRLDLGKQEGLAYYFVSGGLPIVVEDQLIGAVGVGGGNADEQCAYQALQKVLGPQPPLATAAPPAGGEGRGRGGR